ncbi:MAG: FeoB-associated Cys-rich membrane protein [Lachnospiraceae bacterium]|nr:FeoB-associated Cys-rich membrane protein [Lachnospiraceae bacterium]
MMAWILQNIGTIGITLLLIVIVAVIISRLIKDKKQGKSSCGGNCAHCRMCESCRGGRNMAGSNRG